MNLCDVDYAEHEHRFSFVKQSCWCGMTLREWSWIADRLQRMAAGYFG